MSTHWPNSWESECEKPREEPILRLVEHAIGLWRAAQDMRDPVLLEALRPFVVHVAHALVRGALEEVEDKRAH
ncbi:hypothetical protein MMMDOFMJ_3004 [Methylobacterium gnaphalii]|nr:hypothetical protein MMMDOFMJ_3004 [Methylobacterium gnaphalii]